MSGAAERIVAGWLLDGAAWLAELGDPEPDQPADAEVSEEAS